MVSQNPPDGESYRTAWHASTNQRDFEKDRGFLKTHGTSPVGFGVCGGFTMILVISCSLNPKSRSRLLAQAARDGFAAHAESVEFVDLQDIPLPFCDGNVAYGDPNAVRLTALGEAADAILVATPVYNFSVSAATKNLVELTGRSWAGKPVGMLLAAGGLGSYMSGMGLANSLMLDFRCLVIPRFVYAGPNAFANDRIADPAVLGRINELVEELTRVSRALREAS